MSEAGAELLVIGRISGVYGIRGWLKVHSYTEPMENLLQYGHWQLDRGSHWQPVEIDQGKAHGKGLIVHLEGLDDRNAAEDLKGCNIGIPRSCLPQLEDGEYYWHQLEGLSVYNEGNLLGRLDHMMDTGANDVMVVAPCEGSIDQRERLVPWIREQVVKDIDIDLLARVPGTYVAPASRAYLYYTDEFKTWVEPV